MSEQVAIITGAGSGIGRCFARELSRRRPRMRLVLADRDGASLAESFQESETVVLETLDIRSVEQWQLVVDRAVTRFGPIDYLFNIAGIDRSAMFVDQPLSNIDELIDINLKGTLYGMRIVAEQMAARGSGHIINIASLAGIAPTPGTAIYSATKFGLRGLSLATAVELRPRGVHVTVICPDLVDTALLDQHIGNSDPESVALIFSGSRALKAEQVSEAIFRAMRDRPLEIDVPFHRGLLCKVSSAAPGVLPLLYGPLRRRGMKQLERARRARAAAPPAGAAFQQTDSDRR
jgi:short-subunit dehydrogenase